MTVLTSGETLEAFLRERLDDVLSSVENLDNSAITRGSLDALVDNIRGTYGVERLELQTEGITGIATKPVKVGMKDPSGKTVLSQQLIATFRIPYTGLQDLWHKVPEGKLQVVWTRNPLGAFNVGGADHLLMQFKVTGMEARDVKNARKQMLGSLETKVGWANRQVDEYNDNMSFRVRQSLEHRVRLMEEAQALDDASDIPIYRTPTNEQVPIPLERKRLRLDSQALAQQAGYSTDRSMAQTIYEDVVQTIEQMTRAMELTPTAAKLEEEEIRNLILFVLNANYRGAASGEVFNGAGKTDILLKWDGGNAFIGECKFWRGRVSFVSAINQLHRYVTWRDTKAALIVFIRSGSTTQTMTKARKELRDHPTFVNERPGNGETRSDFTLRSATDPDRLISVALVGVVIPPRAKAKS